MPLFAPIVNRIASAFRFGYDAVNAKGRRRAPTGVTQSEDNELRPVERRKIVSGARDTVRNFTVAQWAVRKHLDYTTTFNFQAKTKSDEQNNRIESFMRRWSAKDECDVAGRHNLQRLVRLMEARRTVDGDVFLLRLTNGQLQAIEGDRIVTPLCGLQPSAPMDVQGFLHGVKLDDAGRAMAYALHRRSITSDLYPAGSILEFERMLPARNCYQHAWYERFDQVRGISPMASALNTYQDLYEGFDYALGKMKVAQLFGLVFSRKNAEALGVVEEDEDGEGYKVDFGKSPLVMDLNDGDDAKFIESNSPSDQFQSFSQTMISIGLKALDIPFSFFSENFTNYSGARQALLQYQLSCELKRADVIDLLNWITGWRLMLAIEDGDLDVDPVGLSWEWVAKGIPWIDPLNEVQANLHAIAGGLYSRTRALKEQGLDFKEVVAELAKEKEIMLAAGLEPSITLGAQPTQPKPDQKPEVKQAA